MTTQWKLADPIRLLGPIEKPKIKKPAKKPTIKKTKTGPHQTHPSGSGVYQRPPPKTIENFFPVQKSE
jgi:hypothetical protein